MVPKTSTSLLAVTGSIVMAAAIGWSRPVLAVEPFLGQIEFYAFNFAPRGWAFCDGQTLPINQNQSLYALMGTTFGGDARTTFSLPDLRGRTPVHDGGGAGNGLTRRALGQKGGAETVTLSAAELPAHSHNLAGTASAGNQVLPAGNVLADDAPDETYSDAAPDTAMHAGAIGATAAGPHDNMPPYLVLNCAIALQGLFPSRN
jgi:microcystin-dependent protein